jgi:hypothetical protein
MTAPDVRTVSTYGTFDEILVASDPAAVDLARQVRALIADVLPGVVEGPWPRQRVAGYGVGPRKQSEHFCYIAAHRDHVNLGFNYGAELPDPEGILRGPGARLRHVPLSTPEELQYPALRRLLEVARRHRMPPMAPQELPLA